MSASPDAPRYRGALIGLGGIGRSGHLPAYDHADIAPRLELTATVDALPGTAPAGAIPLVARHDALDARALDFVDICTPTASHVDLAVWALGSGLHVLCEKPVAIRRRDALRIAEAARRAGRIVMPCHQYRHNPVWRQIRMWLDDGRIGRWHLAEFQVYRPTADRGAATTGVPWRGRRAHGLGGVLLDHGTHLIYQLLDVAGPPRAVRAWTGVLSHGEYDVEDTAQLTLDFDGRLGTMFLTWAGHKRETRIRFIGDRGMIDWTGGTLTLESDGASESRDWSAMLDKRSYAGWYVSLLREFTEAMDAGDGERHLADIAAVAGVLEDAYASAGAAAPESRPLTSVA